MSEQKDQLCDDSHQTDPSGRLASNKWFTWSRLHRLINNLYAVTTLGIRSFTYWSTRGMLYQFHNHNNHKNHISFLYMHSFCPCWSIYMFIIGRYIRRCWWTKLQERQVHWRFLSYRISQWIVLASQTLKIHIVLTVLRNSRLIRTYQCNTGTCTKA